MRALAFTAFSGAHPLLRLGLLAGIACLANAVLTGSYTPPTLPLSPAPDSYPVGYDLDRRTRPYAYPARHILLSKPVYPPSHPPLTRGEAKALRWAPPVGYDPRRRPALRRTDTPVEGVGQENAAEGLRERHQQGSTFTTNIYNFFVKNS